MKSSSATSSRQSIKNLHSLLKSVLNDEPVDVPAEDLRAALQSQGALAKLTLRTANADESILPIALNTLKCNASSVVPGGFETLDELRRRALAKFIAMDEVASIGNASTKNSLKLKIEQLKKSLTQAEADLLNLATCFHNALTYMAEYAEESKQQTLVARCNKQREELLARFSLTGRRLTGHPHDEGKKT